MPMVPFQLDVEIRTPLAGGDIPTLDAVLLGEIVRLGLDNDPGGDPEKAQKVLEKILLWRDGVPQASVLLFRGAIAQAGETVRSARRLREMEEIGPRGLIPDTGFGREMRRPKPHSWINHALLANCGDAHFIGVGDIAEIETALAHWQGIGAQWRNGWGEIADDHPWDECEKPMLPIRPMKPGECNPETWGLLDKDGAPARPLPRGMFWSLPGRNPALAREDDRRARPPYWGNHAKIRVVVRGAGIAGDSSPQNDSTDIAAFADDRFARYMLPESERGKFLRTGGPAAAVNRSLERFYAHVNSGEKSQRLQYAVAVITPNLTRLASDRKPEGEKDEKFETLPAAECKPLLCDAAREKSANFIVIQFGRETAKAEHLSFSDGASDFVVVCGRDGRRNIGGFSREKIRRILAIAEKRGLSRWNLKNMAGDEHPDLAENPDADAELPGGSFGAWVRSENDARGRKVIVPPVGGESDFVLRAFAAAKGKIPTEKERGLKKRAFPAAPKFDDARMRWLTRQGETRGFSIVHAAFSLECVTVRRPAPARPFGFNVTVFVGRLKVTDADKFESAMRNGIGSRRGYGCGMLILRPNPETDSQPSHLSNKRSAP